MLSKNLQRNHRSFSQWAKKTVQRSAFFVNSVLKIQCRIVKNTLLQTAFLAILPTGKGERNQLTNSHADETKVRVVLLILCIL